MSSTAGRWRGVLFDFDYTLADSSPGVIECVNFALREMGLAAAPAEHIRATIGYSLADAFAILTNRCDPRAVEAFGKLFLERSEQVMVDLTRVYPCVPAVVGRLRRAGLKLAVVSTKYRRRIEAVLAREKLADQFDLVIGGDQVKRSKPDPEGLLAAMARLEVAERACLYVGDSVVDVRTARNAGVAFAAVLSGVTERSALESAGATWIMASLEELPERLEVAER